MKIEGNEITKGIGLLMLIYLAVVLFLVGRIRVPFERLGPFIAMVGTGSIAIDFDVSFIGT